jgi:hypothetical protein
MSSRYEQERKRRTSSYAAAQDHNGQDISLHDCNYLFVPVTQAIPPMPASNELSYMKRQGKNSVHIIGATVNFSVQTWQHLELGAVMYWGKKGKLVRPQTTTDGRPDGLPYAFWATAKNPKYGTHPPRLMTLYKTGFLDGLGPFELRPGPSGDPVLDPTSGAMFMAKLYEGDGGAVGSVDYEVTTNGNTDQKGRGRRSVFLSISSRGFTGEVGDGIVPIGLAPVNRVRLDFKVNETVRYVRQTSSDIVSWLDDLQICLMLRAPGTFKPTGRESSSIMAAQMKDLSVEVLYS